jgi:pimeloyl-ACP methyl ester carboxylesterase
MNGRPNIILVHGAWADGSSWSGVIEQLQTNGFRVRAPQFPLTSLADDVARLRQVLEFQDGPTIVVGHSYGGQIITALGSDASNVVGLVYIAAFALDEGESLGALLSQGPVTPALAHLFTDSRGYGWLSEDDFVNHFAGDVEPTRTRVLYAVQQALASSVFTDVLVPRRTERRGDPARRRAAVRDPDGSDDGRDPVQPRCDGLPSGRGGGTRREGRRSRWCRRTMMVGKRLPPGVRLMPIIDVYAAKGTSRRLMLVELVDTYLAQHDVQPVTIDIRADDPVLGPRP